jgi:hypothetical protein
MPTKKQLVYNQLLSFIKKKKEVKKKQHFLSIFRTYSKEEI